MKDKEKQIEEMAKDIPYLTLDRTVFVGATETKNVSWTLSEEDNKLIAENLAKKGWVKLPKDSVVLSKEDKARLVRIDTLKNIKSISQLKELLSNITAINDLMGYNDRELEIRQEERKETAEKFVKEVDDCMQSSDLSRIMAYRIKQLAKQFGVEIKE